MGDGDLGCERVADGPDGSAKTLKKVGTKVTSRRHSAAFAASVAPVASTCQAAWHGPFARPGYCGRHAGSNARGTHRHPGEAGAVGVDDVEGEPSIMSMVSVAPRPASRPSLPSVAACQLARGERRAIVTGARRRGNRDLPERQHP